MQSHLDALTERYIEGLKSLKLQIEIFALKANTKKQQQKKKPKR